MSGRLGRVSPELRDYEQWHRFYDNPASGMSWRLRMVQQWLRSAFDQSAGEVRVLSLCSGDGRDVIETLAGRPDADRVRVTLVEAHPDIAARARDTARAVGVAVDVRTADAGLTDTVADVTPVDLLLLVGIFGNINEADIEATIRTVPSLCAPGATVLWSRGRLRGDINDPIRGWFGDVGCSELDYATSDETESRPALGLVRFDGTPQPLEPGRTIFTFTR